MSDSDDTDLLLLIPPDFFLVQSPDIEFSDSDLDSLQQSHNEVHNSLVSDLISQVNDLESRVCMIETLDKSVTHCTSCNDDSLINQSINSLTESDLLRTDNRAKTIDSDLRKTSDNFLQKTCDQDNSDFPNIEKHLLSLERKEIESSICNQMLENRIARPEGNLSNFSISPFDRGTNRRKQVELLREVDSFIETKKKHEVLDWESSPIISSQERNQSRSCNIPSFEQCSLEVFPNQEVDNQSLALPEVYNLLQEMEDTQKEIEDKLKLRCSQSPKQNEDITKYSMDSKRNNTQGSQALPLEEIFTHTTKNDFFRPTSKLNFNQRPKATQRYNTDLNSQTSPSSPQTFGLLGESSRLNLIGSRNFSPNRISRKNTIEVARTNFQKRDEVKLSPRTNFRRSLNFEGASLTDSTKLNYSTFGDETAKNELECIHKQEEDKEYKLDTNQHKNRDSYRPSLEEKISFLTLQRATEKIHQPINSENKASVDSVPSKLSSNNLLSLSELWNKEPTFHSDDPNKLRQKLEEEKYRRQHCEQQIQALQLRVLEEQEKLAVAVKVDQEKDKAIMQISESWRQLNDHWKELEEQRHALAQQLQDEKALNQSKTNDFTKKIERWEKEVSQALDLAAGYKEKSENIQSQMEILKKTTEEKLMESNNHLQVVKEENEKRNGENKILSQQLKQLQDRINEEEELLSTLKVEFEKLKQRSNEQDAEINLLKEQKDSLCMMLKDEKSRSAVLEQQKQSLQQALEEAVKKEKTAREEMKVSSERVDVARTELRALYQGQLESVVKEKLQEFQTQLEAAEAALKTELQVKERQWAEKANEQCKKLQEKFKAQKLRLEEACKEEIKKWQLKLEESERLRSVSEHKLKEETGRRADIAQRLHSVMETQWREALNIISNPLQMYGTEGPDESRQWQSEALERVRGGGERRTEGSDSSQSLAQTEEPPFCQDGQVTYRATQMPNDQQLKRYIQMLLERGPGNPIPNESLQDNLNLSLDDSLPENKWLEMSGSSKHHKDEELKISAQTQRFGQSNKPPWK